MLQNPVIGFVVFLLGFGLLIFVHELGHFLVAKWVGIRCTQFAIGFGHALLTWRRGIGLRSGSTELEYQKRLKEESNSGALGETEYRLNWLPLGGYVKMVGQDDLDPTSTSDDPRSFTSKSVGARFAVISAGVIMNLIFGIGFFVVAFTWGVRFPSAVVGAVELGSPAATTYAKDHENDPDYLGLRLGDRVIQVDETGVDDNLELILSVALGKKDTLRTILVERKDEQGPLAFEMVPQPAAEGLLAIGVAPISTLTVAWLREPSTAFEAGVKPDMRVEAIDGRPVADYAELSRAIAKKRGKAALVTFVDDLTGRTLQVKQSASPLLVDHSNDGPANLLGLVPPTKIWSVNPQYPAHAAGAASGDLIANLAGEAWPDQDQIFDLVKSAGNRPINLTVWRDGRAVALGPITPKDGKIGIEPGPLLTESIVGRTLPDTPAAAWNLPGGSRILSLNGIPVDSWADMQRFLQSLDPDLEKVELQVGCRLSLADRPDEVQFLILDKSHLEELDLAKWAGGWRDVQFTILQTLIKSENPLDATFLGFEKTIQFMQHAYLMLVRMVQGTVQVKHIQGPVGIIHAGTKFTQKGGPYLLFFLGLLSVNLAVINFLPIPIADGGHATFLMIEKIKGSPVSARIQGAAMYFGLALIAAVFFVVTYNDIVRLLRLQ